MMLSEEQFDFLEQSSTFLNQVMVAVGSNLVEGADFLKIQCNICKLLGLGSTFYLMFTKCKVAFHGETHTLLYTTGVEHMLLGKIEK